MRLEFRNKEARITSRSIILEQELLGSEKNSSYGSVREFLKESLFAQKKTEIRELETLVEEQMKYISQQQSKLDEFAESMTRSENVSRALEESNSFLKKQVIKTL
jgi:uncharacterized coiled-coil protein SlyX